ncbi:hypothetical protein [Sorangium sp. So ce1000]|uniref:hypothetical protein n=1 Tax=Sorangium sp. So ce1000 TaxID=3133325 RepID=UPI003F5E91E8
MSPARASSAASARRRLIAWALAAAAAVLASSATAQTPGEGAAPAPPASTLAPPPASTLAPPPASTLAPPPAPTLAPPPAPSAPPGAPAVEGLPPGAQWEATVAAYEARIEALKYEARAVREFAGSEEVRDARERQIALEIKATKRALGDFVERTTERNSPVMMVSGLILAGLGGAALVTGATLLIVNHDEAVTSHRDGYTVALATTAGGVVGLGVGLPLYAIGKKRVPRRLAPRGPAAARLVVGPGAVAASPGAVLLGVGLRFAF